MVEMARLHFKTICWKRSSSYAMTIPKEFALANNVNIGDVFLIEVNNTQIPIYVRSGGNGTCRQFVIPKHMFHSLRLEINKPSKIIIERKSEKVSTNSLIKNGLLDILSVIPTNTTKNKKIHVITKDNNRIIVWIPSCKYWLDITRNLLLDNDLFEFLGLIQGESYKKFARGSYLDFTNSEPNLINKFLNFCEKKLNIPKKLWIGEVAYTGNALSKMQKESLKRYWNRHCNINLRKISNVHIYKSKSENHISKALYGTFHVRFTSQVAGEIVIGILRNVQNQKILFEDERFSYAFLRGLFAADGSVVINPNRNLNKLTLTFENKEECSFYEEILNFLKISYNINQPNRNIEITGWNNFYKMFENKIFEFHTPRNIKFINGFLKTKKTRTLLNYLSPLLSENMTYLLLANALNLDPSGSRKVLNNLEEQKYVSKRINKENIEYSITRLGKTFLSTVEENLI